MCQGEVMGCQINMGDWNRQKQLMESRASYRRNFIFQGWLMDNGVSFDVHKDATKSNQQSLRFYIDGENVGLDQNLSRTL